MTSVSLTEIITAAVAALALLLSIYNFVVERREKTNRLIVWFSQGTNTTNDEPPMPCVFIDVAKPTLRRIVVTEAEVTLLGTKALVPARTLIGDHHRAVLLSGDSTVFWVPLIDVNAALPDGYPGTTVAGRARARDALGRYHYSSGRLPIKLR